MDDVLDRGERFAFRSPLRTPLRLRVRRMTPERSGVTVGAHTVWVQAGTWTMTIRFEEIAAVRVTEWPPRAHVGVHYLRHGRWLAAATPGPLATLDLDPAVTPTTVPRTARLDLGLADPERFVSCITSRLSSDHRTPDAGG